MHVSNVLFCSDWNAVSIGVAKYQVDVKEGGGGSDLNVQWTLNKGQVNMLTAPLIDSLILKLNYKIIIKGCCN